jgi:hypothetical protein
MGRRKITFHRGTIALNTRQPNLQSPAGNYGVCLRKRELFVRAIVENRVCADPVSGKYGVVETPPSHHLVVLHRGRYAV